MNASPKKPAKKATRVDTSGMTKAQKFVALAKPRAVKAVKAINGVEKLLRNKECEFTADQLSKLHTVLSNAVAAFKETGEARLSGKSSSAGIHIDL